MKDVFMRGHRLSALGALSINGMVTSTVVEGSLTCNKFLYFLKHTLVCVLQPQPHDWLHPYSCQCVKLTQAREACLWWTIPALIMAIVFLNWLSSLVSICTILALFLMVYDLCSSHHTHLTSIQSKKHFQRSKHGYVVTVMSSHQATESFSICMRL